MFVNMHVCVCVCVDVLYVQRLAHPTASIIARTATAQDDITGDGTTSNVLFTGELLYQARLHIAEGLHPRFLIEVCVCSCMCVCMHVFVIVAHIMCVRVCVHVCYLQGMEKARDETLKYLNEFKTELKDPVNNRDMLISVAQTSLRTKVCLCVRVCVLCV